MPSSWLIKLLLFIFILDETTLKRAPKLQQYLRARPKIYGGTEVFWIKYPFYARVGVRIEDKSESRMCGGTIISNNEVLTAAHCLNYLGQFVDAKLVTVRTGDFTFSSFDEEERMKTYQVIYYFYYSAFQPWLFLNGYDYAVLVLVKSIVFDSYRNWIPVCTGEQGRSNPNNYTVMIVGLGKIEEGKNPDLWREAELTEVNEDICRRESRIPDTHPRGEIVCSGYGAQSQCEGDSGGPIVLYDDAKGSSVCLYAIPSFRGTEDCGNPRIGSISTRAQYYYDNESLQRDVMINSDYRPSTKYPFFVRVFTSNDGEHRICGGTIITSAHVVTSAHCFNFNGTWIDAKQIDVRTGDFPVDDVDEKDGKNIYKVLYYIYCTSFDSRTFTDRFDYVILSISRIFIFDRFTHSIPQCTGEQGYSNPSNYSVMRVGLGKIEDFGRNATYLKEAELTEVSEDVCREQFEIPASHPRGEIFCSRFGGVQNQCNGVSGGPIVLYNEEKRKSMCLYAMTSYSLPRNCSDPNQASIATRLQYYEDRRLFQKDIKFNEDLRKTTELTLLTSKSRTSTTSTTVKTSTMQTTSAGKPETQHSVTVKAVIGVKLPKPLPKELEKLDQTTSHPTPENATWTLCTESRENIEKEHLKRKLILARQQCSVLRMFWQSCCSRLR